MALANAGAFILGSNAGPRNRSRRGRPQPRPERRYAGTTTPRVLGSLRESRIAAYFGLLDNLPTPYAWFHSATRGECVQVIWNVETLG